MQLAALLWHLRTLSDQPMVVSGIGLARFLPVLLLAPFGGLVADTFDRRRITFLTQGAMVLITVALGFLTFTGGIRIWHIFLLSGLQAAAIAFDSPARQSMVPNLVSVEDFPSAFSLQSIAQSTGAIIGPGLSGLLIGYFGQEWAYWLNAVGFLAVLAALVAMGPIHHEVRKREGSVRSSLASIREGIHFILNHPIILSSMLLDFIATFFSSAATLLPFVARDILKVGEVAYGWLVSGESIGAMLVGLFISQRYQLRRQGSLLLFAVFCYGLATIWFGLERTFTTTLMALVLVGAADGLSAILRNTIRQIQTPDHLRGRMIGINQIFFMGGPQLGEIESGLVAQAFGVPAAIISGGAACILAVVLVSRRWPQLREYSGEYVTA